MGSRSKPADTMPTPALASSSAARIRSGWPGVEAPETCELMVQPGVAQREDLLSRGGADRRIGVCQRLEVLRDPEQERQPTVGIRHATLGDRAAAAGVLPIPRPVFR